MHDDDEKLGPVHTTVVQLTYGELNNLVQNAAQRVARQSAPPSHHLLMIPNTWFGRLMFRLFKRYLNRRVYKLTPRGRTPKKRGARGKFRPSIRLDEGKYFAVYVELKPPYDKEK